MKHWLWDELPRVQRVWSDPVRQSVDAYRESLERRSEVYQQVDRDFPGKIKCSPLCNECCSQTFFVRWLDLFVVRLGFLEMSPSEQERVQGEARSWYKRLPDDVPQLVAGSTREVGFLAEMEDALPYKHLPCPLVVPLEGCQIYPWRPVICRSFGYPSLQLDGRMQSTCEKNLEGVSSEELTAYSLPYRRYKEVLQCKEQLGECLGLSTWGGFVASLGVALAILVDPITIDWHKVIEGTEGRTP
ncbi:MAG: hypothetical protein EP343_23890 [Deltaproteobacteria bacterium]|nr:MAG: hypothetical protein EP343_23890 [Deltaproteobacteria bacterium]